MQLIAWIFYSVLTCACLISAGFIVFHIARYSLRRSNAMIGIVLFLFVFSLLLLSNILLFAGIPFESLASTSSFFPAPATGF